MKKLYLILALVLSLLSFAQNEFITVWKPSNPSVLTTSSNIIYFPGYGTNYTIYWEEIGYPNHNATINNVTSNGSTIINFGTPSNPIAANATYRVKVSTGNGIFHRVKFSEVTYDAVDDEYASVTLGDRRRILEVQQWGNIVWSSMEKAFSYCYDIQITATDSPILSQVTDASYMFFNCNNMTGHPSMNNWDVSHIQNFHKMLADSGFIGGGGVFNTNINNWNLSNATDITYILKNQPFFNQPLNNWDISNLTSLEGVLSGCGAFNQNINNWDTSSVTNMTKMFFLAGTYNQPLSNWDTSHVTTMKQMFEAAERFNQPIGNWNTSATTDFSRMFMGAVDFNQSIGSWGAHV